MIPTLRPLATFRRLSLLLLLPLAAAPASYAQSAAEQMWTDVNESAARSIPGTRLIIPEAYRTLQLDRPAMEAFLAAAPDEVRPGDTQGGVLLALPLPRGGFGTFEVIESSVMEPGLQAQFPQIRSYLGRGITDPTASVRISMTPDGFRAQVLAADGALYVDPYSTGSSDYYLSYRRADYSVDPERVRQAYGNEIVEGAQVAAPATVYSPTDALRNGETLRTYRLAVAATGEYTTYHSTLAGHASNVADGMAAIVVMVARVTGVYEREVAVRMVLVANNNLIVYTTPGTDPYTNVTNSAALNTNQSNIDLVIGSANYDIGHLVATGDGGVAGLGVVCGSSKARGTTGLPTPNGDAFYIDYVAHEMGHQFRGNHTFNGSAGACAGSNRNAGTAYEPGSGSTIMAYAGICGAQNTQNNSDPYFHAVSLDEIIAFTTTGSGNGCAVQSATGNTGPTATSPAGFHIPVRTPFELTGSGTDDTPGSLTYGWEEFDLGAAGSPTTAVPPLFRSFNPTASPSRTFPARARLLAGLAPVIGENYPTDSRTLNFRMTVRDNAAGGGGVASAATQLVTHVESGPFIVTFANTAGQVFGTGVPVTITWNVAGTDANGINTATVDILFSSDNGVTFPTVLAAATANDGSETVTTPASATTQGRIMVRAVGNVFFNFNAQPFTLQPGVANEAGPESAEFSLSTVYPNPATVGETATLNLTVTQSQRVTVALYDVLGRRVADLHDGTVEAGRNLQLALATAALRPGAYFVAVVGESFSASRRVIIAQ